MPRAAHRHRQRARRTAIAVVLVGVVIGGVLYVRRDQGPPPAGAAVGRALPLIAASAGPTDRTYAPYAGLGTWVDGFDYGEAYQKGGAAPPITPDVVDDLAAHDVKTLYLQAAREDTRTPNGIVDPATTAAILVRAHRLGIAVVAWYLPRFRNPDYDLANLERLADFSVLGHRFDGIAVDIEFTDDVPDTDARNALLVDMSAKLRRKVGTDVLGAIVLPPVQTEVLNKSLWPDFPWSALDKVYDVWLPMSYWTFRTGDYADGYTYNVESTRRLRNDLDDPNAVVHGIGGIGDLVTPETLDGFGRSLADTRSIGGSIYDWNSMTPASREEVTKLFAPGGPAANLPAPPAS